MSNSPELSIRYHTGIPISAEFTITGWEATINDEKFVRQGNQLNEGFLSKTESLSPRSEVLIVFTYTDAQGVSRKKSGVWVKPKVTSTAG